MGGLEQIIERFKPECVVKVRHNTDPAQIQFSYVKDGDIIHCDGFSLQVLHLPGHSEDQMCLHLLEDKAVFSADTVLGQGTTTFMNLKQYLHSLQMLKSLQANRLYPGHGKEITDVEATINFYIQHRQDREKQIMEYLSKSGAKSVAEIVTGLYVGYPKDVLLSAEKVVRLHLEKLRDDPSPHVEEMDSGKWEYRQ